MAVRHDSTAPPPSNATTPHSGASASDDVLRDLCVQIHDRLVRVEAALQRTEGFVAEKPWDVSTIAYKRLERVEETVRLTQKALADNTLPEMCVNIEKQVIQTRKAVQRTEEAVAENGLHELCANIDARLTRTEDSLRRTEAVVSRWLETFSAHMAWRFTEAEETIRRIEHVVSGRSLGPAVDQSPLVKIDGHLAPSDDTARQAERLIGPGSANIDERSHLATGSVTESRPWTPAFAVPAFVLLAAVVITAVSAMNRSAGLEKKEASPIARVEAPAAPAVAAPVDARPAAVPKPTVPKPSAPSTRERQGSGESQRDSESLATGPRAFVGTLSVTSIPSGAPVWVNGKAVGVTPVTLRGQRAGSHAVQIAQDGFERWSAAVRVPADQLTQVTAQLLPVAH